MQNVSTASVVADFLRYRVQSRGFDIDVDDEFEVLSNLEMEVIPHELHDAIINLTDNLMSGYRDSFRDMRGRLNTTQGSVSQTFTAVTKELVAEGAISWGRIVALFSFGGALCEWCLEENAPRAVQQVKELMTAFIDSHLKLWIADNGGWAGLVDFYQLRHSNGMWSGKQLAGVATLGILTVGAFFFRS